MECFRTFIAICKYYSKLTYYNHNSNSKSAEPKLASAASSLAIPIVVAVSPTREALAEARSHDSTIHSILMNNIFEYNCMQKMSHHLDHLVNEFQDIRIRAGVQFRRDSKNQS